MHPLLRPFRRYLSPKTKYALYNLYRRLTSVHRPDGTPNVLLFTMPRSGSTWLMELIWSQPGFKCVNEPFDVRNPLVRMNLGLESWEALQSDENKDALERYMKAYISNQEHATEARPFNNTHYRFLTNRIVFKIIHAGENEIPWFRDTFNGRVVFMTRHPIPVALSHESYPRLESYLNSDFSRHFSKTQLELADRIIKTGTRLQQGVLDWCFQNTSPLRERQDNWAVLTYEQLVLDPEPAIHYLAEKLELPDESRMRHHLGRASGVKRKSDSETKSLLEQEDSQGKRVQLVGKWRNKVSESEEREVMHLLEVFGVTSYSTGSLLPTEDLWIGDKYTEIKSSLEQSEPALPR